MSCLAFSFKNTDIGSQLRYSIYIECLFFLFAFDTLESCHRSRCETGTRMVCLITCHFLLLFLPCLIILEGGDISFGGRSGIFFFFSCLHVICSILTFMDHQSFKPDVLSHNCGILFFSGFGMIFPCDSF